MFSYTVFFLLQLNNVFFSEQFHITMLFRRKRTDVFVWNSFITQGLCATNEKLNQKKNTFVGKVIEQAQRHGCASSSFANYPQSLRKNMMSSTSKPSDSYYAIIIGCVLKTKRKMESKTRNVLFFSAVARNCSMYDIFQV